MWWRMGRSSVCVTAWKVERQTGMTFKGEETDNDWLEKTVMKTMNESTAWEMAGA